MVVFKSGIGRVGQAPDHAQHCASVAQPHHLRTAHACLAALVVAAGWPRAHAQSADPCNGVPPENCIHGDEIIVQGQRWLPDIDVYTDDGNGRKIPFASINPFANSLMCGDAVCSPGETCPQDCGSGAPGGTPPDPSGDWSDYATAPLRANPDLVPGIVAGKTVDVTLHTSAAAVDRTNYDTAVPRAAGDQAAREYHEIEYDPESAIDSAAARGTTEVSTADASEDSGDTEPSREQSARWPPPPQGYDDDLGEPDAIAGERTDPVHPGRGEFAFEATDIALSGVGLPFVLRRTYRSGWSHRGLMGHGWTSPLEDRLWVKSATCARGEAVWGAGDGGQIRFEKSGGKWVPNPPAPVHLVTYTGGHRLVEANGTTRVFDRVGRLQTISDANFNVVRFEWATDPVTDAYLLRRVHDTVGRVIELEYGVDGYLERVLVPSGDIEVRYEVDGRGDLVAVTDADGLVETYAYLHGFTDAVDYVPTDRLERHCDEVCHAPAGDCSGRSVCDEVASRAVADCVADCHQPASCTAACGAGCAQECQGTATQASCLNGAALCGAMCNAGCISAGLATCEDRRDDDDRTDAFWRTCDSQCKVFGSGVCDANFSVACVAPFASVAVAYGNEDGEGYSVTPQAAGTGGHVRELGRCIGFGNCVDARRAHRSKSLGWPYGGYQLSQYLLPFAQGYPRPPHIASQSKFTCSSTQDCYWCLLYGVFCPDVSHPGQSPHWYPHSAAGHVCLDDCVDGKYETCRQTVMSQCGPACNSHCDEACFGQCQGTCAAACERGCESDDYCRTRCSTQRRAAAEECASSCESECLATRGPPSGVAFGRRADLNHNLLEVRRLGTLYVSNAYYHDVTLPNFDRVSSQTFGADVVSFSYYDLATHYQPVSNADGPLVTTSPDEVELCGNDCRVDEPGRERWVSTSATEYAVFDDPLLDPAFLGAAHVPAALERYGWYQLERSGTAITIHPPIAVPRPGIRVEVDGASYWLAPHAEGGLVASRQDAGGPGRDLLGSDDVLTLLRTRQGWRAFATRPLAVMELNRPSVCEADFSIDGDNELLVLSPPTACVGAYPSARPPRHRCSRPVRPARSPASCPTPASPSPFAPRSPSVGGPPPRPVWSTILLCAPATPPTRSRLGMASSPCG